MYSAISKVDKNEYAIKVFDKDKMTNTDVDKPALLKEIFIMRKLNKTGIIRLHEVHENEN